MPGYLTHWKVLRDAAMLAGAKDEKVKALLAARAPVRFPNGDAPGKEKDAATGYYGGGDAISAFAYLGAHAPSFFYFGLLRGRDRATTTAALAAGIKAARQDLPMRDRLRREGFAIAPFLAFPPGAPAVLEIPAPPPAKSDAAEKMTPETEHASGPRAFARDPASDLLHQTTPGTAILNLLALARTMQRTGNAAEAEALFAFAAGAIAHLAADAVLHPALATLAGDPRYPGPELVADEARLTRVLCDPHRFLELHLDSFVALASFGRSPFRGRWVAPLETIARDAKDVRPLEKFLAEIVGPGLEATYGPGAGMPAALADGLRFYREVMIPQVYGEPDAVLPAVPLTPLLAPGPKDRASPDPAAELDARKPVADAARALAAIFEETPKTEDEKKDRRKRAAEQAKKTAEAERKLVSETLLGSPNAAAAFERISLAAKLAARLMLGAAKFFLEGDEGVKKALENWNLDSGYRLEVELDKETAKGSFPRVRVHYRHVLEDLAKTRLFDLDVGDAPKETGKTFAIEVRLPLEADLREDQRFILAAAADRTFERHASLLGDGRRVDEDKVEVTFTGVEAGKGYSLFVEAGEAAYTAFADRKLEDGDLR